MKRFILIFALVGGIIFANSEYVKAQNISISVNIGNQPSWGPVGYDYVDYYYFPDFNAYFDVNSGLYIFMDRGRWITAQYLPMAYRHYDLYKVYKVALNINKPWLYNNRHIKSYGRYKNYHGHQIVIRDSRDRRYDNSRYNHRPWRPNQNVSRPQPNHRPNTNIRPDNRPSNKPESGINRPNNRPNNNNSRPNSNNSRPNNSGNNINRPNKENSRPSYNSRPNANSNKNKNNNSRNRQDNKRSSSRESGRTTYIQTRF